MHSLFLLVFFILFSWPALAAQKQIGQQCKGDEASYDWDTLAQCNGTLFDRGPIQLGKVASPRYQTTVCDASKAGMLQWTGSAFSFCNGTNSNWSALTLNEEGNIGIGTSQPQARLDVHGSIRPQAANAGTSCSPLGAQAYDSASGAPLYCNAYSLWTLGPSLGINSCHIVTAAHPAKAVCPNGSMATGGGCKCNSAYLLPSGGYPTKDGYACNAFCTTGSWDWSQAATAYAVCCQ